MNRSNRENEIYTFNMDNEIRIIGLLIKDRIKESGRTQQVLSEYSHLIKTRLGFHEVSAELLGRVGFIILHISGDPASCEAFENELNSIGGIELKKMVFDLQ